MFVPLIVAQEEHDFPEGHENHITLGALEQDSSADGQGDYYSAPSYWTTDYIQTSALSKKELDCYEGH